MRFNIRSQGTQDKTIPAPTHRKKTTHCKIFGKTSLAYCLLQLGPVFYHRPGIGVEDHGLGHRVVEAVFCFQVPRKKENEKEFAFLKKKNKSPALLLADAAAP